MENPAASPRRLRLEPEYPVYRVVRAMEKADRTTMKRMRKRNTSNNMDLSEICRGPNVLLA